MVEARLPRFKSAEAALRFYYRAQELLSAKGSLRLFPEGSIPSTGRDSREDLMLDFLSVASCLKDLNELQRWLLHQLYSPVSFGEPARSVAHACDAGRRLFPRVRWTLQGVGRLKTHTLKRLEYQFANKNLIMPRRAATLESAATAPDNVLEFGFGGKNGFPIDQAIERSSVRVEPRATELAASPRKGKAPRRRREVAFDHTGTRARTMPDR